MKPIRVRIVARHELSSSHESDVVEHLNGRISKAFKDWHGTLKDFEGFVSNEIIHRAKSELRERLIVGSKFDDVAFGHIKITVDNSGFHNRLDRWVLPYDLINNNFVCISTFPGGFIGFQDDNIKQIETISFRGVFFREFYR